jgi:tetratricopeptide (TPR) repeat protein
MPRITWHIAIGLIACLAGPMAADDFKIDEQGDLIRTATPEPGSPAARIARIRRWLADDDLSSAIRGADRFIEEFKDTDEPLLAEAYLLRGDIKVARRSYYQALYDYEFICRTFPASEQFVLACERELDIVERFAAGLKRRWFGLRIMSAEDEAEELLVILQERLPGSEIAERAGITLADYYFRKRMMNLAIDAYDLFLANYPNSELRQKALENKVFAHIATFKGPEYDGSGLDNARLEIDRFQAEFPRAARELGIDDSLRNWVDESAATKMLSTARWYLKQDDYVSGRYVMKRLLARYPSTEAGRRAAETMLERGWIETAPEPTAGGQDEDAVTDDAESTEAEDEA